jgi:glycosyltransferase involved in cell wall biosynthesis
LTPLISIIIPIKEIEVDRFLLLINSINHLRNKHNIEVLIIYSNESPEGILRDHRLISEGLSFYYLEPKGIYNAFNFGISKSTAKWVMFFGGDDFLLPSISGLLMELEKKNYDFSAIVCKVIFGNKGVFSPYKSKYGLIFKNWCQQGVIYNKILFESLLFDENYKMQADHKFNIEISSNPLNRILYLDDVISYFNNEGVSQTINDINFRADFPNIISVNFGKFFGFFTFLKREGANYLKYRKKSL